MVEVKSSGVKSIFWNVMSDDGPVPCSVERFYRFVYFFLDGVLRMESHFVGLVLILQFLHSGRFCSMYWHTLTILSMITFALSIAKLFVPA